MKSHSANEVEFLLFVYESFQSVNNCHIRNTLFFRRRACAIARLCSPSRATTISLLYIARIFGYSCPFTDIHQFQFISEIHFRNLLAFVFSPYYRAFFALCLFDFLSVYVMFSKHCLQALMPNMRVTFQKIFIKFTILHFHRFFFRRQC